MRYQKYIIIMIGMALVVVASGCTTLPVLGDNVDKVMCNTLGGAWDDSISQCCPKTCPERISNYASDTEKENFELCCGSQE